MLANECGDELLPIGNGDLCRTIRVPVDGRRRPFDTVDSVRVTEYRQPLGARGFAGVVHFVSVKVFLSQARVRVDRLQPCRRANVF